VTTSLTWRYEVARYGLGRLGQAPDLLPFQWRFAETPPRRLSSLRLGGAFELREGTPLELGSKTRWGNSERFAAKRGGANQLFGVLAK
jgi:hypothetical protein